MIKLEEDKSQIINKINESFLKYQLSIIYTTAYSITVTRLQPHLLLLEIVLTEVGIESCLLEYVHCSRPN